MIIYNSLVFLFKIHIMSLVTSDTDGNVASVQFFVTSRIRRRPSRASAANSRSAFMNTSGWSSFRKGDYQSIRGYIYTISVAAYGRTSSNLHVASTNKKRIQPVKTGNREQIAPESNMGEIL